jgi:hypothetical protein
MLSNNMLHVNPKNTRRDRGPGYRQTAGPHEFRVRDAIRSCVIQPSGIRSSGLPVPRIMHRPSTFAKIPNATSADITNITAQ